MLDRAPRGSAFAADAQPDIRAGDGTQDWPEEAPFDRIPVSATDGTPAMLLEQLRPDGIVVLPVGQTDEFQQLIKIEKTEDGPSCSELCDVLFVSLAEGCSRLSGTDRLCGCIEVGIEGMIRTRFSNFRALPQTLTRAAAVLTIAGCATQSPDRAATSPAASAAPSATVSTAPDASGIVTYDGYQAALARSGDTVASVAQRIGMSASELGAYNGLSPTHPLRPGDEMVLPPRSGGYSAGPHATVPLDTGAAAGATDAGAADPAASDGVGWSPDLAAAAIDRAAGFDEQGDPATLPSTEEPLPPNPQAPSELASPQFRQYQSPAMEPLTPTPPPSPVETTTKPEVQVVEDNATVEWAATAAELPVEFKLIRPVVGPVVVGFNQGAWRARNDGIDFASPSGAPVVAAASGEVALVSQPLGGLGTTVFLRHSGDYLTVYGRIENVTVSKGDFVGQGQKIGVVTPSTQPRMHFEVRHGAETLDPVKFF